MKIMDPNQKVRMLWSGNEIGKEMKRTVKEDEYIIGVFGNLSNDEGVIVDFGFAVQKYPKFFPRF